MKITLFPFQEDALYALNQKIDKAHLLWQKDDPQVISFSAPTGAGKTIIMTSLFEDIFCGNENRLADPDAVIVWLSDSPMLNEQTRYKIERQSTKIRMQDLVMIDSSFDAEVLEGGKVYFLNTQKLGTDKLLTTYSDVRQYSIWETLTNTAEQKPKRLYVVIDEAHRGTAISERERNKANSIMQKFILGSPEDGLCIMPLVIGVTATPQRFEKLVAGTQSTIQKINVPVEQVRDSGLLKDRVIIHIPEIQMNSSMTVLKSAVQNWLDKCRRWDAYCERENLRKINPILVIQVEDSAGISASATDISVCIDFIEEAINRKLNPGEVVHTFNDKDILKFGQTAVFPVDASRIEEDETIKVVFFKMNLSTGWDCPRAETMMSFRGARDYTYIAQLLGRLIRTPLTRRIESDAELNNVSLFLPYFDEETVNQVVDVLSSQETAAPTDIGTSREFVTLSRNHSYDDVFEAVKKLVTCRIDSGRKQQPIPLLMQLSRRLTWDGIAPKLMKETTKRILEQITKEIDVMKADGSFQKYVDSISGFSMEQYTYEYGEESLMLQETAETTSITGYDLEKFFEKAGKILGEGLHYTYWTKNSTRDKTEVHMEIIALTQNTDAMKRLNDFAENSFLNLFDKYKDAISHLSETQKQHYTRLIASSPVPVAIPWQLPDYIDFNISKDSGNYRKHLYVNDSSDSLISLNPWEKGVLLEELDNGAVCWLRNLDRKGWSLAIPYEVSGVITPMFPDLIIVRAEAKGYVFDILEPHDPSRKDNCAKAVGLAKFAESHWDKFGRIELIRQMRGPDHKEHFYRLNMGKLNIRNLVRGIKTNEELDRIFDKYAERL